MRGRERGQPLRESLEISVDGLVIHRPKLRARAKTSSACGGSRSV